MDPGRILAALVIVGGGYYLLTGINPLSWLGLGQSQTIDPNVASAAQTLAQREALAAQQKTASSGRAGYSASLGAAGAVGGIATTAGVAASTALLATGIAAAGGLLVWGIVQRGWFRGGEEGIKVNPARDEFLNVWVQNYYPGTPVKIGDNTPDVTVTDPVTGLTSTAQYSAMVRAFHDAGVRGDIAEGIIGQIYAARTMDAFGTAAEKMLHALQGA